MHISSSVYFIGHQDIFMPYIVVIPEINTPTNTFVVQ